MEGKQLKVVAQSEFENYSQLYKIVDFLNRSLKHKNIVFGLTSKDSKMYITIYEE